MTDSTGGSLNAAYEAIKAKDLSKARDVLSTYLIDNPNDVDAWWLYSYAVTDIEQARKALETVLRLDPAYPGARDLLTELENTAPASAVSDTALADTPAAPPVREAEISGVKPLSSRSADTAFSTTPAASDDDAEFGFADETTTQPADGGMSRTLIAALAALVVILFIAAILILPTLNGDNTSQTVADTVVPPSETAPEFVVTSDATPVEATEVVVDSTAEITDPTGTAATSEVGTGEAPTDAGPTEDGDTVEASPIPESSPEPTAETAGETPFDSVYSALEDFDVVPNSAALETTTLGETLAVSICTVTSELRTVIPEALTELARSSQDAPAEAQAIGARFVNCADNAPLRYVALPIADAQNYANGVLTDAELRSRFVPLP